MYDESIGKRLRTLRNLSGHTKAYVCENAGMSKTSLWMLEADKRNVRLADLNNLCKIYNLTLEDFFSPEYWKKINPTEEEMQETEPLVKRVILTHSVDGHYLKEIWICPYCNKHIDSHTYTFCPYCGKEVSWRLGNERR